MRKRTGKRYVPISISLPMTMVNDIESELDAKQSRSEWIADAITAKMGEGGWSLVDNGNAIQWLYAFKNAMKEQNVHVDAMFWQILESNCREAVESKASTDEHSDQ